ncbi:MAG: hypothetical protein HETSPECPRED_000591 [Heterodermia speciosa]|uniref:Ricin B lectin domain-containing protein n=1 Tax=Heterodermia speciosa TaxID=116794 RepID=A0A8H3IRI2_9LECA|nr:MAG: hypothetical protein HETSPECPRED_000591 [Heterodermia speciosa]
MTAAQSGYQGPGFYNILSLLSPSNVAASLSKSAINSPVVAQAPLASDYTQSWLFADVGNGHVTIINNVTGGILTAWTGDSHTFANVTPPYSSNPNGIWSIDNTTWQGPVILKSLINTGTTTPLVLDLTGAATNPGTPLISFPLKPGGTVNSNRNQAWILQPVASPF